MYARIFQEHTKQNTFMLYKEDILLYKHNISMNEEDQSTSHMYCYTIFFHIYITGSLL